MKWYKGRGCRKELGVVVGLANSSFRYKPHPGQRGMKASTHTSKYEAMAFNADLVEDIRFVQDLDYSAYGCQLMTFEEGKWAQIGACSSDGQQGAQAREDLSRTADAFQYNQTIGRLLPALTNPDNNRLFL